MDPWNIIDAALLDAATAPVTLADLAEQTGYPADVVKSLVHGHLTSGHLTQILAGCDRYQLTLSGRAYLSRITATYTAASAADTRKAA